MVEAAPPDALDPMQSHYLFHRDSAFARGETTERQQEVMAHDPQMSGEALHNRETTIAREKTQDRQQRNR